MKWLRYILVLWVCLSNSACARTAQLRITVVNDEGVPMAGQAFSGNFMTPDASAEFSAITDTNGIAHIKGPFYGKMDVGLQRQGFYNTWYAYKQPYREYKDTSVWTDDITIPFRRIRNPIPLFVQQVENPYVRTRTASNAYNTNNFAQYDMVRADFLPPHGDGEVVDMEFIWRMDIHESNTKGRALSYDTYFDLKMPNIADGIMRGDPYGTGSQGSSFMSDYEAPLEGYTNRISFYTYRKDNQIDTNNDRHRLYYFRVRTQTNELGQVTNAYYGKVYGSLTGAWTYYLNPTPNDRNIEYDRKNNLNPKGESRQMP